MATNKFICTSSEKLDTIPFQPGQIMFTEDARAIYVDGTTRTCYQQIIFLGTEAQRESLPIPLHGFYFVEETKILWEYDSGWHQLTQSPEKQIVFDDKDNFPEIGDFQTIYIDGTAMYRYLNDQYVLMNSSGGGSIWIEI